MQTRFGIVVLVLVVVISFMLGRSVKMVFNERGQAVASLENSSQ